MDELTLTAYATSADDGLALLAGVGRRAWIDATPEHFAARCLPLVMANQSGWWIVNRRPFRAKWKSDDSKHGVVVEPLDESGHRAAAESHFGSGVLTFTIPWLFRTPPGWNLLARGPANWPKDGITPLEGLVETDWSPMTFTMNWLFTRHRRWVYFDAGEPICQLVPQRRGELEAFTPLITSIDENEPLHRSNEAWGEIRDAFNAALDDPESEAYKAGWQRHYMLGRGVLDEKAPESHQTKLRLREFAFTDAE